MPAIIKAKLWVEQGRIGKLRRVQADFGCPQLPFDMAVMTHLAPNGVEDDVSMLFDYGANSDGVLAALGTSYRCKLSNSAYIIGEEGTVVIPDFFRANQCSLYQLDNRVDHFEDGRQSIGLNYEVIACGEDILAGRQQNRLMPWSSTVRFQELMARVRNGRSTWNNPIT